MRLEAELAYLSEIQSKTATVSKTEAPPKRETVKKEKAAPPPQAPPQAPTATTSFN